MIRNILLIVTDQQRFDSLSCYGCDAIDTPNLDRLAADGARFTNCYVNNPVCTPSRASMFTGKPIPGHGVYRLHDDLPADEVPFPWHLQRAGYRTALFGKLHLSSRIFEDEHRHPHDGFDIYEESKSPYLPPSTLNAYLPWLEQHFPELFRRLQSRKREFGRFPEDAHLSRWVSTRTVEFLRQHDRSRPFFCYASFFDPHDPYNDYPESMARLVRPSMIPSPLPDPESWEALPTGIRREHEHGYLGAFASYEERRIHEMRVGYYASVAFMDQEVGRILAALEELGYAEETLVLFTSDHGDMLGDHGLLAKGAFFYEPCVKVPLIIRAPGVITPGTVCDDIVQGSDAAATILAAARFDEAARARLMPDSHDLVGTASGRRSGDNQVDAHGTPNDRAAICLYRGTSICDTKEYFDPPINAGMYRRGDYKLNLYFSDIDEGSGCPGQLFDLGRDPNELNNLWWEQAYSDVQTDLVLRFAAELNQMDLRYNSSRGGQHFPPRSHWSQNNPL